jgi:hypothetical protein
MLRDGRRVDTRYAELMRLRGNKSTDSLLLLSQGSSQVADLILEVSIFCSAVESGDPLVTLVSQIHNTFGERPS